MPTWLSLMQESLIPLLKATLFYTLPITFISFILGLVLGLLTALFRLFSIGPIAVIFNFYVWIIRGTPLLVQLFVIFYSLPGIGIVLSAFTSAIIGFTLNVGAYTSEAIRTSITAIPKGQWEAAYSIGMSWKQAMIRIILPQAIRTAIAPTSNSFISLLKDTSLAASITLPELFQTAQRIVATTYEPLILYIEVAIIYLLFSSVLSSLQKKLEKFSIRYE
ncbi:Cystine ABC transporter, permease protein [Liberibacter crescens BT-1]|uniref:Cystine ABC transporter, permease protein n=1 Tax=Liberibacter crescens (strain BT-1) TaxID=1215343 RepID=L0ESV5_LIBCB|nr:amino acid ABC transporter permease [Liberibacter crescens]AGA64604.1 Cystine ABC transporter, permease protein [Liberibacter crescens BT-1]AMC12729.1 cysteine ABC transporter permease [Liberibacter crescens]